MSTDISHAYSLLVRFLVSNGIQHCDLATIEAEVADANEELSKDEHLFATRLTQVASSEPGVAPICESLAVLRISAINLATIYSNLADAIESVVVALSNQSPHETGG